MPKTIYFYKNMVLTSSTRMMQFLRVYCAPHPTTPPPPPPPPPPLSFYANNRITPLPTKSHSEKVSPSFPSLQPTGSTGFSWSYDSRSRTTWSKPTKIFRDFSYILNLLYKNQGKFFLECIIFLQEKKG